MSSLASPSNRISSPEGLEPTQMQIGFLGFGEAASTFVSGLQSDPRLQFVTYDRVFSNPDGGTSVRERAHGLGVRCVDKPEALAATATVIFSTVTADQSLIAAQSLCRALTPQHLFFDMNSVSPGKKRETATQVIATGARYVDVAVMAPVHPRAHKTPLLVASPDRDAVEPLLRDLGWNFEWKGDRVGDASVVKMLRSILIKGMESLISECVTAAEPLGIADEILASAGKTLGISEMSKLADYVMERVAVHGQRRSEEMREVAITLEELGLSHWMASAIAEHQQMVANFHTPEHFNGQVPQDRRLLADYFQSQQRHPD